MYTLFLQQTSLTIWSVKANFGTPVRFVVTAHHCPPAPSLHHPLTTISNSFREKCSSRKIHNKGVSRQATPPIQLANASKPSILSGVVPLRTAAGQAVSVANQSSLKTDASGMKSEKHVNSALKDQITFDFTGFATDFRGQAGIA